MSSRRIILDIIKVIMLGFFVGFCMATSIGYLYMSNIHKKEMNEVCQKIYSKKTNAQIFWDIEKKQCMFEEKKVLILKY